MNEDSEDKLSEEDMNWEDFMNVVTTYSCKFCTFTCTVPEEMGKHVKRTHLPKKIMPATAPPGPSESQVVSDPSLSISTGTDEANTNEVNESVKSSTTVPEKLETSEVPSDTVTETSSVQEVNSSNLIQAAVMDGVPVTLAIANGIESSQDGHFIIVEEPASLPDEAGADRNSTVAPGSALESSSEATVVSGADGQLESAEVKVNELDQYSVITGVDSSEVIGSPAVTKELYLCGQCSVGFGSIEECREHMLSAHSSILGEATQETSAQVSVGTQMAHRKKPGRKRKSEIQETAVKRRDPDEDDEDWEPGYDISGGRDSRKKRKIRTPKALKEDYFIGRKKKKKKVRRSYTDEYTLKCKLFGCHAKFKTQDALDLHIRCHNDCDFNFSCISCQDQFDNWKTLKIHLWKLHSIDCDLFECEVCGIKTDTFHKLSMHKEIHSDNRPYTCDICGKGFKQFSQMRNHQVIHSEYRSQEPDRWYSSKQCSVCKRVFANQKCLKKHEQAVHSKEKPFSCPYCGHSAARKAMLELHIRTHTGEKPYKCDVCPYSTGDHNSLRRHKMRHTGQRQYKCQYCSYSCIQAISLKTHMKNKHPGQEGIYACDACIFITVNKLSYEQHILDHKNGLVPEFKTLQKQQNSAKSKRNSVVLVQKSAACIPEATAVEMHVQTMASGEAQISAEDLAKLSNCEGLVAGDISATSLIYQALSVISQIPDHTSGNATQSAHILGGVQTLIKSSDTEQGVTTHTITFHVPKTAQEDSGEPASQESTQVYFEQPVEVIEALHRAGSQQAELSDEARNSLPTVITMEASETDLEEMNLNLVPVTNSEGTIIVQEQATA